MQTSTMSWLVLAAFAAPAYAEEAPIGALDTVTVTSDRPAPSATHIAATIEGVTRAQIENSINATDSEDALKYLPSLNVRKRYIGDYDHAVLASRASGSGNSARSLVFADGILLSNLLGNGASYAPRWGLVTPAEIERVDVLYGPYSAAYSGNSAGAVVQYVTRMPKQFEAEAKLSSFSQASAHHGNAGTYRGTQAGASLGDRRGDWAWRLDMHQLDSNAQPLTFANRLVSAGTPGNGGVPVTGAFAGRNPANRDWLILGEGGQIHTLQDHLKIKLAHDFSATLTASYVLGWWRNDAVRSAASYLRDASGNVVSGSDMQATVNIDGRQYRLTPADFAPGRTHLEHVMQAVSLKSRAQGAWDWEASASQYDYARDVVRAPTGFASFAPAAGTLTDLGGTGWRTLAFKGRWRGHAHVLDFGLQDELYQLRTRVSATADWVQGSAGQRVAAFNGNSGLRSLYAQDNWTLSPDWKAMLGGRIEQWRAFGGALANATRIQEFGARKESSFSPKAALAYTLAPDWTLKAASGRAVRNPTVAELFQGALSGNVIINHDPDLRAEKSSSRELTAEHDGRNGVVRATWFFEQTRDALYAQTNVTVVPNVTTIQNIEHIRTRGLELAAHASDAGVAGLDLSGSMTWTDSRILQNDKFPQSTGKQQPRVPRWRATAQATYRPDAQWSASIGARYSGRQYGTLDNSDINGAAYTGFSDFFVGDVRLRYQSRRQWNASLGVDNVNKAKYWAFHPYAQRTVMAELVWAW